MLATGIANAQMAGTFFRGSTWLSFLVSVLADESVDLKMAGKEGFSDKLVYVLYFGCTLLFLVKMIFLLILAYELRGIKIP